MKLQKKNTINKDIRVMYKWLFFIIFAFTNCKKFVEIPSPSNKITGESVFDNDGTAIGAVTKIYADISNNNFIGANGTTLSFLFGLSADELNLYDISVNTDYTLYYTNNLNSQNGISHWAGLYNDIFNANSALEGLSASTNTSLPVRKELLGEAYFSRAFCYFYLVNLYGDVPLVLSTDFNKNKDLARSNVDIVYQQIVKDLVNAQSLLSNDYLDGSLNKTSERTRPNKATATALLARVYLYIKDFADAEEQSSTIIQDTSYHILQLSDVFLSNSEEAIWQLQGTVGGINTQDAQQFIMPYLVLSKPVVSLSKSVLENFENNDKRKTQWISSWTNSSNITYYYPYKYKVYITGSPVTEYETVFRLGEQYLIRAEARAELGKLSDAQNDLNVIRTRAGLPNTSANSQEALVNAIYRERQSELFTEWGHRWFDLKRTGRINAIMPNATLLKGGIWNNFKQFCPIPLSELNADPSLIQNTGY